MEENDCFFEIVIVFDRESTNVLGPNTIQRKRITGIAIATAENAIITLYRTSSFSIS